MSSYSDIIDALIINVLWADYHGVYKRGNERFRRGEKTEPESQTNIPALEQPATHLFGTQLSSRLIHSSPVMKRLTHATHYQSALYVVCSRWSSRLQHETGPNPGPAPSIFCALLVLFCEIR